MQQGAYQSGYPGDNQGNYASIDNNAQYNQGNIESFQTENSTAPVVPKTTTPTTTKIVPTVPAKSVVEVESKPRELTPEEIEERNRIANECCDCFCRCLCECLGQCLIACCAPICAGIFGGGGGHSHGGHHNHGNHHGHHRH